MRGPQAKTAVSSRLYIALKTRGGCIPGTGEKKVDLKKTQKSLHSEKEVTQGAPHLLGGRLRVDQRN